MDEKEKKLVESLLIASLVDSGALAKRGGDDRIKLVLASGYEPGIPVLSEDEFEELMISALKAALHGSYDELDQIVGIKRDEDGIADFIITSGNEPGVTTLHRNSDESEQIIGFRMDRDGREEFVFGSAYEPGTSTLHGNLDGRNQVAGIVTRILENICAKTMEEYIDPLSKDVIERLTELEIMIPEDEIRAYISERLMVEVQKEEYIRYLTEAWKVLSEKVMNYISSVAGRGRKYNIFEE